MMHLLRRPHPAIGLILGLLAWGGVQAESGIERLRTFNSDLETWTAEFTQITLASDDTSRSEDREVALGSVTLARPGRFRWDYTYPYEQHVIADGSTVWIYDVALKQVTERSFDRALAAAPITFLVRPEQLTETFEVAELGRSSQLDWVRLTPRAGGNDFEFVLVGLNAEGLRALELHDTFDRTTRITFQETMLNAPVDADAFEFTPPPDVDVVREAR